MRRNHSNVLENTRKHGLNGKGHNYIMSWSTFFHVNSNLLLHIYEWEEHMFCHLLFSLSHHMTTHNVLETTYFHFQVKLHKPQTKLTTSISTSTHANTLKPCVVLCSVTIEKVPINITDKT